MIYSFTIADTPVHVYNSPLPYYVEHGVLTYSFATNSKTCLAVSCAKCPIYAESDCGIKLRRIITSRPDFISKFPELLL